MGGLGGAKLLGWRSFFALGWVLGPRWPQDPPKTVPRPLPSLTFMDFGPQLADFTIFLLFFLFFDVFFYKILIFLKVFLGQLLS